MKCLEREVSKYCRGLTAYISGAMRYSSECLHPPLLLFRKAKSQSLLGRCETLVPVCLQLLNVLLYEELSLCQNRDWDPRILFLGWCCEYLCKIQGKAPPASWSVWSGCFLWSVGLFQMELCIEFDLNLSGFGKLKLNFSVKAHSYRKVFWGMWPGWPSYYCCDYIR